ncbi:amino acid permease [Nocardia salmonicida]|uniref:amino acid permease n=1 Tax=Nocardia salmonicida TaxID=53431 RepID=UPI003CF06898
MTDPRPTGVPAKPAPADEDAAYRKELRPHQLEMIAIGGAIGTGLFLGAGARLQDAGAGLFIVYAVCGIFVFFILRALGELVLYRPSAGSFVAYAREFYGEKLAFGVGWMYFFHWCMTGVVDITAIATYVHYWGATAAIPQWVLALAALVIVVALNMVSVKWFGEMEFWVALIKVMALSGFLIIGTVLLIGPFRINGSETGPNVIADNGGLLPHGVLPLVVTVTGVVFAYAAVELVGTAAGEVADPEKIVPRAINTVMVRVALFYVGSLVLLAMLLPYNVFRAGISPFVTFFAGLGIHGAGSVMNLIVLTAAFSSLNAGLYSTGRILRSMSMNGSAPKVASRMTESGVPYVGILATAVIALVGVALNAIVPKRAFEIVLNMSALGTIAAWAVILICQLKLWHWARQGRVRRPGFRLVGTPYTTVAALLFLIAVVAIMAFGPDPTQRGAVIAMGVVVLPLMALGWFLVRRRVAVVAALGRGTGTEQDPVRPLPELRLRPVAPPDAGSTERAIWHMRAR